MKVGDKVRWTSSNVTKLGVITRVVPAGKTPRDVGDHTAGGGGMPCKHESYVLKGQKLDSKGCPYGPAASYWPVISQIEVIA